MASVHNGVQATNMFHISDSIVLRTYSLVNRRDERASTAYISVCALNSWTDTSGLDHLPHLRTDQTLKKYKEKRKVGENKEREGMRDLADKSTLFFFLLKKNQNRILISSLAFSPF